MKEGGANRESEPSGLLRQESGSTSVESNGGSSKANSSSSLLDGETPREIADHEDEVRHVEEEEEDNHDDIILPSCQEENECKDEPASQKDSGGVGELFGVVGKCSRDAERGVDEGRVGKPETTKSGESARVEQTSASTKLPHASNELSKTADKAGHADDGIRGGDTTGLDVVHRGNEGGASEGEKANRTGVGDPPPPSRGAMNIWLGRENRSIVPSVAVDFVVGVRDGTLFVVHGGKGWYRWVK